MENMQTDISVYWASVLLYVIVIITSLINLSLFLQFEFFLTYNDIKLPNT